MKKFGATNTVKLVALLGALASAALLAGEQENRLPPKQYLIRCVTSRMKDGKPVTEAEPQLIVAAGQEGHFFAGGEIKADDTSGAELIPFGVQLRAKVTESGQHPLRLSARLAVSNLIKQEGPGLIVHESSLQLVQRAVKLGEAVDLKMDDGLAVRITIQEVKPKPAIAQ